MRYGQRITLFLARITIGWLFFYAGITKVLNPEWTAAGYLKGAKTFTGLYEYFLQPHILPTINILNEWGLTLIGLALMLGVFVRLSSCLGALLMILYYLPILDFPHPNTHAYIVDEHIVYITLFLVLASLRAGRVWGIDAWWAHSGLGAKFPYLYRILG